MKLRFACSVFSFVGLIGWPGLAAAASGAQAFQIGHLHARAIWSPSGNKSPTVIMVPGSGPMGPRELIPGYDTVDGQDAALFDQMAAALQKAGVQTLQLGKPGVEDQSKFDLTTLFYDKGLYSGLHWQDLLSNLNEAFKFVSSQPTVDLTKVYILGHSEGTQVAVDYAKANPKVAGVILLGYAGEDISTIVDWQIFRREIDDFIEPDVDANHDGLITQAEASRWPNDFSWDWKTSPGPISLADIEKALRADPNNEAAYAKMKNSPLYSDGIWNRGPIYAETAALAQPVYIFTGALDEQTPPDEALKAKNACAVAHKSNCFVTLVPGVGHGFSPPKPPRSHPFLDMTVGPANQSFLDQLTALGQQLGG